MPTILKQTIQEDVKQAMRARDKARLGILRLLTAAIKQREIDSREVLDDTQILAVLNKLIKQRKDSIVHYAAANRQDLQQQEEFEITVLQHYLPPQLSDLEVHALIQQAVTECHASSIKDMGKVMAFLKVRIEGRADIASVSQQVKQQLNG